MKRLTKENININTIDKIKVIWERFYSSSGVNIFKNKLDRKKCIALNKDGIVFVYSRFGCIDYEFYSFATYGITWALTKGELK